MRTMHTIFTMQYFARSYCLLCRLSAYSNQWEGHAENPPGLNLYLYLYFYRHSNMYICKGMHLQTIMFRTWEVHYGENQSDLYLYLYLSLYLCLYLRFVFVRRPDQTIIGRAWEGHDGENPLGLNSYLYFPIVFVLVFAFFI